MRQQNESSVDSETTLKSLNDGSKALATQIIERKVQVLEAMAHGVKPIFDSAPKSMRAFRDWVDPELGLQRIGSPSTTNRIGSPHNYELIERAIMAMRRIKVLSAAKAQEGNGVTEGVETTDMETSQPEGSEQ